MTTPPLEPASATEVAAILARAATDGRRVVPRGSGTKGGWNGAPAADALLSTRGLASPIEHYAGDLVATIPAGATLAEANAVLAGANQWLPLDPTHSDRATIGGIVATNDSGPRRHKHGAPRDLIIGVEIAMTDGRIAKSGGRVVKNVAGYDLARLLCGSYGSLAVITSATFKLAPTSPVSHTVVAQAADVARAVALAHAVAAAPVTPSSIEIQAPTARLLIRFESTKAAAEHMAAAACTLLQNGGAAIRRVSDAEESDVWLAHDRLVWAQPGCVVKISVLPTELGTVLDALRQAGPQAVAGGGDWDAVGRAALGVLLVRIGGSPAAQAQTITALRRTVAARQGHLTLLEASEDLRRHLGPATAGAGLEALMQSVKSRFDPRGILPAAPRPSP